MTDLPVDDAQHASFVGAALRDLAEENDERIARHYLAPCPTRTYCTYCLADFLQWTPGMKAVRCPTCNYEVTAGPLPPMMEGE